jgi:PhzF family phenazine biosynthesis protein
VRIRIIDAFADGPFTGNPAAVLVLDGDGWPPDAWLRSVAAEINQPMTAFVLDDGLRWILPSGVEERLCGHATLAVAHALAQDGHGGERTWRTLSGELRTHAADDGLVTLDFPAAEVEPAAAPDGLHEALGAPALACWRTGALRDLLVELPGEDAVRALQPDMSTLAALNAREDLRAVTVTAPGTEHDVVSRFFSPNDGLPEDPVTGSTHTAVGPLWAARLGRDELVCHQASARGGTLRVTVRGDRVLIAGRAVTVLDGELRAGR